MGMFDTINLPCPKCRKIKEKQSGGGRCVLAYYNLDNADASAVEYIMDEVFSCDECKTRFKIEYILRPVFTTRQLNYSDKEFEEEEH